MRDTCARRDSQRSVELQTTDNALNKVWTSYENVVTPVFRTFLTDRSKTWNGIKLGVFFIQIRWLGVSWESVYP
jgi:hypothetical protein